MAELKENHEKVPPLCLSILILLRNHTILTSLIKKAFHDGCLETPGPRNRKQPVAGRRQGWQGALAVWRPPRDSHSPICNPFKRHDTGPDSNWCHSPRRELIPDRSVVPGGSTEVYRGEAAELRGPLTISPFPHLRNGTILIHQVPLLTGHCVRPWGHIDEHAMVSVLKDRTVQHNASQNAGRQEGKELVPSLGTPS